MISNIGGASRKTSDANLMKAVCKPHSPRLSRRTRKAGLRMSQDSNYRMTLQSSSADAQRNFVFSASRRLTKTEMLVVVEAHVPG